MVRNYKKKTNRQSWSTEAMNNAVEAVVSGQSGYSKASIRFDVPQSTLERYVRKRKENPHFKIDKAAGKFKNVFTEAQELDFVDYLRTMEAELFGLAMKDFRRVAYEWAVRNGVGHRFPNGIAGQDWVDGFLRRHPALPDIGLGRPSSEDSIVSGAEQLELSSPSTSVEKDMPSRVDHEQVSANSINYTSAKKVRLYETDRVTPGCSWMTSDDRASSYLVSPEILLPVSKVQENSKRSNAKGAVSKDSSSREELDATIKDEKFAEEERIRIEPFEKENKINNGKSEGKCSKINGEKDEPKRVPKSKESDSEDCSDYYHTKKRYLKRNAVPPSCNLPDWKNWKQFVEVADAMEEVPDEIGDLKVKEEPSEDPISVCKEEVIIPDEIDEDPISVPTAVSILPGLPATTQVSTAGIFLNNSVPIFVTNPIQFPTGNVLRKAPEVREVGVQVKSGNLLLRFLHFVKSDSELHTATGIRDFLVLERIVDLLKSVQPDRPNANLDARDRVVMTYVKLRQNLSYAFLGMLFHCSPQHCKKIIYETVRVLSRHLGEACRDLGLRIERSHQKVKAFRLVSEKMPSNLVSLTGEIFAVIRATVSLNSSIFREDGVKKETPVVKEEKTWCYGEENGDLSENIPLKNCEL